MKARIAVVLVTVSAAVALASAGPGVAKGWEAMSQPSFEERPDGSFFVRGPRRRRAPHPA